MRFHIALATTAALALSSAAPAFAGSPTVGTDDDEVIVADVRSSSSAGALGGLGGGAAIAALALVAVAVAASGSSDTPTTTTN
ncbi:hypothetical protein [Sulfitobacter pacificus]|uniref:hypothetical protein n=1 Tax=Sulfitobacter pacificus TaxID=1499314 RepID=UPI003341EB9E